MVLEIDLATQRAPPAPRLSCESLRWTEGTHKEGNGSNPVAGEVGRFWGCAQGISRQLGGRLVSFEFASDRVAAASGPQQWSNVNGSSLNASNPNMSHHDALWLWQKKHPHAFMSLGEPLTISVSDAQLRKVPAFWR